MKHKSYLLRGLLLLIPFYLLIPIFPVRLIFYFFIFVILIGKFYANSIQKNLTSHRYAPTTRLFYGETGYIDIEIKNGSFLPAPYLLLEDKPDFYLNFEGRQLFLFNIKSRSRHRIRYLMKGTKRGQFALEKWSISSADLFGNISWSKTFNEFNIITVFPRIFNMRQTILSYRQPYGLMKNKFPIFEDNTKIQSVRPYRPGDENKKINWKLSAKKNELLVNQFTPSISQKSFVFLDMYTKSFDFRYSKFYMELGIEITASTLMFLHGIEQECGFLTYAQLKEIVIEKGRKKELNENHHIFIPASKNRETYLSILESLAKINPQEEMPFENIFDDLDMSLT
ncbi:MAG: DUF58 domain-containing protein, partial [Spirochaetes bacterium]|nr:DUF58 domain-containing protein [Spirochaetota bacterium]